MSEESPVRRDDNVFQGEDKQFKWPLRAANGTPINVVASGYTLALFLFTQADASGQTLMTKAHASFTFASTGAFTNAITGAAETGVNDIIICTIADTDTIAADGTIAIAAGTWWYELWKVNEGDEQMLAFGDFVLRPSRRRQQTS